MITRGEVRSVREMSGPAGNRVQAEVCLGASTTLGSAVIKLESKSERVLDALMELKTALAEEALELTKGILADQLDWDREKAARVSATGVPS